MHCGSQRHLLMNRLESRGIVGHGFGRAQLDKAATDCDARVGGYTCVVLTGPSRITLVNVCFDIGVIQTFLSVCILCGICTRHLQTDGDRIAVGANNTQVAGAVRLNVC